MGKSMSQLFATLMPALPVGCATDCENLIAYVDVWWPSDYDMMASNYNDKVNLEPKNNIDSQTKNTW
eukprot:2785590-Heterocapsa_arctica.AAC.1